MSGDIAFVLILLTLMVTLFLTEKIPFDLTAVLALITLVFFGYLTPAEAFSGFSSAPVIVLISTFIIGTSFVHTGLADLIGKKVHQTAGNSEFRTIIAVMLTGGAFSAFMSNAAVVAILMPAVASISKRSSVPPSRLFIPLSVGVILGGTVTMVGTAPNIIASTALEARGLRPLTLFEFAPLGLPLLALGTIFTALAGRHLLPAKDPSKQDSSSADSILDLYKLEERLFSIRIPENSSLDGKTLGSLEFGSALNAAVVAIIRGDMKRLAPKASDILHSGDVLLARGRFSDVKKLLDIQSLEIDELSSEALSLMPEEVTSAAVKIQDGSDFINKTLRQLDLRRRFEVLALGILREERRIEGNIARIPLRAGDILQIIAEEEDIATLANAGQCEILEQNGSDFTSLHDGLFTIEVAKSSPLAGSTISEARMGELLGLRIVGMIRDQKIHLALDPNGKIEEGDALVISGSTKRLDQIHDFGRLELKSDIPLKSLENEEIQIVEASLSPRSSLISKSVRDLNFRERYGMQLLAIWRAGTPLRTGLSSKKLLFGDALLMLGPRKRIPLLAENTDFILLTEAVHGPRRKDKAPFAVFSFLIFILLVLLFHQPVHFAACTGAALLLLTGVLKTDEAYKAVEWKIIVLVGAMLPLGMVMERTGAALYLAQHAISVLKPFGFYGFIAAFFLLSSAVSQALDSTVAVVLLAPITVTTALAQGLPAHALMLSTAIGASIAFLAPFSHKAMLLVMGAGGYRARDYFRMGAPLTVISLIVLMATAALLW